MRTKGRRPAGCKHGLSDPRMFVIQCGLVFFMRFAHVPALLFPGCPGYLRHEQTRVAFCLLSPYSWSSSCHCCFRCCCGPRWQFREPSSSWPTLDFCGEVHPRGTQRSNDVGRHVLSTCRGCFGIRRCRSICIRSSLCFLRACLYFAPWDMRRLDF